MTMFEVAKCISVMLSNEVSYNISLLRFLWMPLPPHPHPGVKHLSSHLITTIRYIYDGVFV